MTITPDQLEVSGEQLSLLVLEITGKCQLECVHCYADSGPQGNHGAMTFDNWARVISDAATCGVRMVQFIGGEPLLHPDLPRLINHTLDLGVHVEVFSNLVHVTDSQWDLLSRLGVSVATSYYSDTDDEHARITGRKSHAKTKANIVEALRRNIPLRVGIIDIMEGQHVDQARRELESLGVRHVSLDHARQFGRATQDRISDIGELCGHCADSRLAVSPSGEVWPCVMARWLSVGNVQTDSLASIVTGSKVAQIRKSVTSHFSRGGKCNPHQQDDGCSPGDPMCHPAISCQP